MARQDLVRITASLAGRPLGEFATFSGGKLTAEDQKKSRGGGQQQRSRGGRKTVENVTIGREHANEDVRAENAKYRGKADAFTITYQKLDDDGNPYGPSETYVGTLVGYQSGDSDADGDGTLDVEYEMSVSDVA